MLQQRRIDLSLNDLGDEGICELLKFCGENKSVLTHLIIGYNNATFKSLNELVLLLRNGGIVKELNLDGFLVDLRCKSSNPHAESATTPSAGSQPL